MLQVSLVIAGYLFGAIPFGLVFGKMVGIDVRSAGSGNIGATNVNRLLGKKLGALTLAADALKAYLPMLLACWILTDKSERDLWVALVGGAAFLGHIFPAYLGFKGGKGVATALGVFLYLQPVAVLVPIAVFVAVVYVSGYVSLGSLTASAAMPVLLLFMTGLNYFFWLAAFVAALVWLKHRDNISRLIRGEENSFKKKTARA